MSSPRVVVWRDALAKLGALWCILLALCLLDAVISRFRAHPLEFHVLPGESIQLTGPVGDKDQSLDDLVITGNSANVQITVDAIRPGFWLGGSMWHARVTVSPDAVPGDFPIRIHARGIPADKVQTQHLMVHQDAADYQKSSTSLVRRYLNVSAWWLTLVWALLAVPTLAGVFVLSGRVDKLLAREGRAEIYLIRPTNGDQEIVFALGTLDGVKVGTRLDILDRTGRWIGFAEVRKVTDSDGLAWVRGDCPVDPESIVVMRCDIGPCGEKRANVE